MSEKETKNNVDEFFKNIEPFVDEFTKDSETNPEKTLVVIASDENSQSNTVIATGKGLAIALLLLCQKTPSIKNVIIGVAQALHLDGEVEP